MTGFSLFFIYHESNIGLQLHEISGIQLPQMKTYYRFWKSLFIGFFVIFINLSLMNHEPIKFFILNGP